MIANVAIKFVFSAFYSSLLHSISDPSRNVTSSVPSSNTLIWSSVFSIKSVSISFSGFASFVYSTNFSARYPARRSSPCICCLHCSRKLSRFSTSAFQAIRYAFTNVSSSTWRLSHPWTPFTRYLSLHCHTFLSYPALLRHPFREKTLLQAPQTILEANGFVSGFLE